MSRQAGLARVWLVCPAPLTSHGAAHVACRRQHPSFLGGFVGWKGQARCQGVRIWGELSSGGGERVRLSPTPGARGLLASQRPHLHHQPGAGLSMSVGLHTQPSRRGERA